eukprot:1591069-Prymnesium_polylepis.1
MRAVMDVRVAEEAMEEREVREVREATAEAEASAMCGPARGVYGARQHLQQAGGAVGVGVGHHALEQL